MTATSCAVRREIYGIPPERVVGSSNALRYGRTTTAGTLVYLAEPDVFDDGPAKPVRIWSRIGAARSSPVATPTATSRCCGSPVVRSPGAAPAGPARRRRARVRLHEAPRRPGAGGRTRLDGRQREGRLGDRLRRRLTTRLAASARCRSRRGCAATSGPGSKDLVAGLAAGAVVIPQAMAYATIAGLPVEVGLYTCMVPMVVYALLGGSRSSRSAPRRRSPCSPPRP